MTGMTTPPRKRSWFFRGGSQGWSSTPVHPLLFALLPGISLLAHNISQIHPEDAIRPLALILGATVLLWLLLGLVLREASQAAFAISMLLLLFFSFGHIYLGFLGPVMHALFSRAGLVGSRNLLVIVWAGLGLLSLYLATRRRLPFGRITTLFNLIAVVALVPPISSLAYHEIGLRLPVGPSPFSTPALETSVSGPVELPDIYYIILDGYAREDILRDRYGIDESAFLTSLEGMGFSVASESRSNYAQTALSLASSLNLQYLPPSEDGGESEADERLWLARWIRSANVLSVLRGLGYRIYAFESGARVTDMDSADVFLTPDVGLPTNLERLLLETSALVLLPQLSAIVSDVEGDLSARRHQARVFYTLAQLPALGHEPGPKFIFVHLIVPHPPFIMKRDGTLAERSQVFSFDDGNSYEGTQADYIAGYREQALFIAPRIENVLRGILKSSSPTPVIILQADHGPGSRLVWNSVEETDVRERFGILNAVLLPCAPQNTLPETLTPVNTFRYVFQTCFHLPYVPLPDRSYFSTWNRPFEFIEVSAAAIAPLDDPTTDEPGCGCGPP